MSKRRKEFNQESSCTHISKNMTLVKNVMNSCRAYILSQQNYNISVRPDDYLFINFIIKHFTKYWGAH